MKAIKQFNNNVVLCIDENGNEVIARGKGIGFHEFPYELDLSRIERTYYNVDKLFLKMINELSDEIIDISTMIVDYAINKINHPFNANIIFTLADHLNFTIERYQEHMNIQLPISYDVQYLFEEEYDVGCYGLKLIKKKMNIELPAEEAVYIAIHLVNAEKRNISSNDKKDECIIEDIVRIIENKFEISINKNNFNYSRFVSHMHYLLKRSKSKTLIKTENASIFEKLIDEYPKTYEAVELIAGYCFKNMNCQLTDEEKLYLLLHINRLCTREECDQ